MVLSRRASSRSIAPTGGGRGSCWRKSTRKPLRLPAWAERAGRAARLDKVNQHHSLACQDTLKERERSVDIGIQARTPRTRLH
eukprot:3573670-Prymnesium_polylepis.1